MSGIICDNAMEKDNKYTVVLDALSSFNSKASLLTEQFVNLRDTLAIPNFMSIINDMDQQYLKIAPLGNILPNIDLELLESPILKLTREANIAISGLTVPSDINIFASLVLSETSDWLKQINPSIYFTKPIEDALGLFPLDQQNSAIFKISEFAVQSNFAKIAEISTLAESSLLNLELDNLGEGIGINFEAKTGINDNLFSVSDCYLNLFKSFRSSPVQVTEIGPSLLKLTPIEYFNEVDLCQLISVDMPSTRAVDYARNKIFTENQIGLQQYLPRVNSDLLRLWDGAKKALESDNPDKIRHFSISIRELFTHLLHIVAPDSAIEKWTSDEKYFHKGMPTREARVMYICRDIDNGDFHKFVIKDVSATLEFLNLFQEGTHSIRSQMTSKQLMAIKSRAESTLRYIIEIAT